jgi:hypothetical protein
MLAGTTVGIARADTRSVRRSHLLLGINDNAVTVLNWAWIRAHHPERTGVSVLRVGLSWSLAEPREEVFRWGEYDRLFALEAHRGLELLPVLGTTPKWAGPSSSEIPAHPGAFARFMAVFARRYGPDGAFWREHPELNGKLAAGWLDVWNEPYINNFNDFDSNPGRYARLVRAVGATVHRADPRERLLMETNTYYETPTGALVDTWIPQSYAAVPSLNRYFDAVSVHPYCTDPLIPPTQTLVSCQRVQTIHDELAAHGAGNKPLWVTEFGWNTCNDGGGTYPGCVSYQTQAANLRTALSFFSVQPYIDALFPYGYENLALPKYGIIDTYGLLDWGGRPKPAYRVWRAFTTRMIKTHRSAP